MTGPHDRTSVLLGARPLVLGRDAQCDVVLHDPAVAPRHAVLQPGPHLVEVAVFGGTSGVLLDGWPVQRAHLAPGHLLRLGATDVTVDLDDEMVGPRPPPAMLVGGPSAGPAGTPFPPVYAAAAQAGRWAAPPARRGGGGLFAVVGVLVALAALAGLAGAGVFAYRWVDEQRAAGDPRGGGKPASGGRPAGGSLPSTSGAAADIEPLHFDRNPFEGD